MVKTQRLPWKKVVIVGAGLHGRMIAELLSDGSYKKQFEIAGFMDDDKNLHGKLIDGNPVLGSLDQLPHFIKKHSIQGSIVGFSDAHLELRAKFFGRLRAMHLEPISAIHPSSIISKKAEMGLGVFVAAGVIINSFATIGDNSVLYTSATIDHNNRIGENVWISPGVHLAGDVTVGDHTFIGVGVSVIPHVKIGRNVTVGAGTVVIKDIPDDVVVVGVPARIIKHK